MLLYRAHDTIRSLITNCVTIPFQDVLLISVNIVVSGGGWGNTC